MRNDNFLLFIKYFVFFGVFSVFFLNQLEVLISGQGDVRNYRYLIEIKMLGAQKSEPFLKFLIILINYLTNSPRIILLTINTLTFLLIIYISQLFVKKNVTKEIYLILMMGLSVALLSSLQTTMRQGLGYIFFFYFVYSIIYNYKFSYTIIFLILASLCHNIFFILGGIILLLNYLDLYKINYKKLKIFFVFTLLFLISNFLLNDFMHLSQKIFSRQTYININNEYDSGLRIDFIGTNMFVIMFIIYLKNFNFNKLNHSDKVFINILLSSIIAYIFFRDLPYIDRFFYASWIFYPIILVLYIENKLLFFISFIFVLLNYLYKPVRYEFYLYNIL